MPARPPRNRCARQKNGGHEGDVLYPNINPMEEMVNMMSATRSYEANLEARKATGGMKKAALDLI